MLARLLPAAKPADLFKERAGPLFAGYFCLDESGIAPI
jgi:hypothetical protein